MLAGGGRGGGARGGGLVADRAVAVFSGGLDSACYAAELAAGRELYGITFSYGQRAARELEAARELAGIVGLKEHRVADMGFMAGLYGGSNALTGSGPVPESFDYSIVVPARNAVFLTVAAAWALEIGAGTVAYAAHSGDLNYPDCRPEFSAKLAEALNLAESDGIASGSKRKLQIASPYAEGRSKSDLLRSGHGRLGADIFRTWSCYLGGRAHCGRCESCRNRRAAFAEAGIRDLTEYL